MSAEEVTDIVVSLKNMPFGCPMLMPIKSIDGVVCHGSLEIVPRFKRGTSPPEHQQHVKLEIIARYKSEELYVKVFPEEATHQDIIDFIKTIPELKYCHITSRLHHNTTEWRRFHEKKFMHDLFSEIANDNMRVDFGDCPVCLESCYTNLPCGHNICLQCESKLKETSCPQCRAGYARCVCYGECDCE